MFVGVYLKLVLLLITGLLKLPSPPPTYKEKGEFIQSENIVDIVFDLCIIE